MDLHVAILAGGRGERFWPWSRAHRPKQVLALVGDRPLLTATVDRARIQVPAERTWVVSAEDQKASLGELSLDLPESQFLWEPVPRNTGPAVGAIATQILARSEQRGVDPGSAVVLVLPSDHWIPEPEIFWDTVARAEALLEREDYLVTFGLPVRAPETGYGYIERGERLEDGVYRSLRFHEKPDLERARAYLESGTFYWNSGIFLFRASTIVAEIARHVDAMANPLRDLADTLRAKSGASPDSSPMGTSSVASRPSSGSGLRDAADEGLKDYFRACPSISIDHAVMEKSDRVAIVEAPFSWSDVGSWTSWADLQPADASGNRVRGDALLKDARGNIICSADEGMIAILGVDNLVVVRTGDVTVVCPRNRAQEIRELVAAGKLDPRWQRYL